MVIFRKITCKVCKNLKVNLFLFMYKIVIDKLNVSMLIPSMLIVSTKLFSFFQQSLF